ncbi:hypothetical protein [Mycobacterium sp. BK086]|nr:hypothetical protein [Mycobacterium sp. BK086]
MITRTPDDDAKETEGRDPPIPIDIGKEHLPEVAPGFQDRRGE